jgi:ubiquinone/menaquinone biosynthesis C-methylase UbiE
MINIACGSKPTRKQREKIVPRAFGDVLEIGLGGGLNLPFYNRSKVRKIFGLEPSAGMRRSAATNIETSGLDVELIDLPGEEIPLDDNSVDSVLVTYTLCTIPDAVAALEGMRRVLKPNGRLFFCEPLQFRVAVLCRRLQHEPRHTNPPAKRRFRNRR